MRFLAATLLFITMTTLALAPAPVLAHHSAAMFDVTRTFSVEGVVTRYEWANPHVYIFVAQTVGDGQVVQWEVECQPPAMLRRQGWSADTLSTGDSVRLSGNPHREGRKSLLLTRLQKAGTTLYDPKTLAAALLTTNPPFAAAAPSLAGVWVTLLDMDAVAAFTTPAKKLALTEAGAAAVEAYDERTMNPGVACIPSPAPGSMIVPDVKRITIEGDTIRIAGEYNNAERIVHMGAASHDGAEPSVQGHSIGRFEGNTLAIDTAVFAPHAAGNGFGLRASARKHLSERLTLEEGGTGLAYTFDLADPEVLATPFTGRTRWVYRPDLAFAPAACDRENARRFTQE